MVNSIKVCPLRKKGLHSRGRKLDDGGSRVSIAALLFCCFALNPIDVNHFRNIASRKKGFPSSDDELREEASSIFLFRGFSIPFSFPIDFKKTCRHSSDFFSLLALFPLCSGDGSHEAVAELIRTWKVYFEGWEIHQREECAAQTLSDEIYLGC